MGHIKFVYRINSKLNAYYDYCKKLKNNLTFVQIAKLFQLMFGSDLDNLRFHLKPMFQFFHVLLSQGLRESSMNPVPLNVNFLTYIQCLIFYFRK